jgi:hypothetical protein
MAWIKDGKIHKIVTGHMESTFHMNLEAHKKRGWKIKGNIKRDMYGLSCLMVCERKGVKS